jgi:hypothetical protein
MFACTCFYSIRSYRDYSGFSDFGDLGDFGASPDSIADRFLQIFIKPPIL